ncbi:PAS domain protein [uncultured archaeon]|nr:PAS domain protein [uncultured archaeon]
MPAYPVPRNLKSAVKSAQEFTNSPASLSFRGMMVITDLVFRTMWISPSTEKILGYKEATQTRIASLVRPDEKQMFQVMTMSLLMEEQKIVTGPFHVRHQNGTYVPLECTACPILDKKKEIIGYSICAINRSEEAARAEAMESERILVISVLRSLSHASIGSVIASLAYIKQVSERRFSL